MKEKNISDLKMSHTHINHHLTKTISSEVLLGHSKQVCILHDGHSYQLRITKLGKLILTK